jgi:hypothetical protein
LCDGGCREEEGKGGKEREMHGSFGRGGEREMG